MDPDATLAEIRALLRRNETDVPLDSREVDRLAELVRGLDGWMSAAGFLPTDWSAKR